MVALVLSLSLGTYARPKAASQDIVDTAVAAGSFKTLAAALQAAGLVDTLKGKGPFTVFAPTDEAFAQLHPGTVEDLLKPENKEKLVAILTYHVVPGRDLASQVVKMTSARTVNGQSCSWPLVLTLQKIFRSRSQTLRGLFRESRSNSCSQSVSILE